MKILVVGAGATGGYFGACLARAGRDVTFLVRDERADFLSHRGLRVVGPGVEESAKNSTDTDKDTRTDVGFSLTPRLLTAGQLAEVFDVVLLTVKASALEAAIRDVAPAVGPATVIVPFLNGMAHMDALAAAFGAERVLGSIVHLVGTLNADGDIAILTPLARWTIGEQFQGQTARMQALLAEISVPGIEAIAAPNGLAAMWGKWVFIVAAGVVTCLMRGPVGDIAAVPGGPEFVAAVLAEGAAVAAAAGFPVPEAELAGDQAFLSQPHSPFTSSLHRDVTAGLSHEGEHIVGDFSRRAAELGIPTPLTNLALMQLRVHDAGQPG